MTVTPESVREWARWAEDSPLYQALCEVVAADSDLLEVLNRIENTPKVNILFAAVQYLMAKVGGAGLEEFYPNFTEDPRPVDGVGAAFASFVSHNRDSIVEIGSTRFTQTNECRRCVALLPMIWMTGVTRLHLVDVGASAGLNLALDRYSYRWGPFEWGPSSPVVLEAEARGRLPEPVDIEILSRTGIDLDPVDPADPDDRLWLESLVWPEHHRRRDRLRSALAVTAAAPVRLIAGDALDVLPDAIAVLPSGDPVVVMNSFVLNQFSSEGRGELDRLLDGIGRHREVFRVSMEAEAGRWREAALTVRDRDGWREVGAGHHHGDWVRF